MKFKFLIVSIFVFSNFTFINAEMPPEKAKGEIGMQQVLESKIGQFVDCIVGDERINAAIIKVKENEIILEGRQGDIYFLNKSNLVSITIIARSGHVTLRFK